MPSRRPFVCPACCRSGNSVHHPTGPDGEAIPGDLALCLSCGEAAVFDAALRACRPGEGVLEAIEARDPQAMAELRRLQAVVREQGLGIGQARH